MKPSFFRGGGRGHKEKRGTASIYRENGSLEPKKRTRTPGLPIDEEGKDLRKKVVGSFLPKKNNFFGLVEIKDRPTGNPRGKKQVICSRPTAQRGGGGEEKGVTLIVERK